jgi:hypothetical protein
LTTMTAKLPQDTYLLELPVARRMQKMSTEPRRKIKYGGHHAFHVPA